YRVWASTSFPIRTMGTRSVTSPGTCQSCGKAINGKPFRFSDDSRSVFCSLECQIAKTRIVAVEVKLAPITIPLPPSPAYTEPVARKLHDDRGCDCGVLYENQITIPKRHSVISLCPKCGGVTTD